MKKFFNVCSQYAWIHAFYAFYGRRWALQSKNGKMQDLVSKDFDQPCSQTLLMQRLVWHFVFCVSFVTAPGIIVLIFI